MPSQTTKEVVLGVSPDFAMTQMDDEPHPECDLYVEDRQAGSLLREILVRHAAERVGRVQIVPFGAASVGQALGQMVENNRFPRPSLVFLDGDQPAHPGCMLLPGNDAPERVVFAELQGTNWGGLHTRLGRSFSETADACARSMTSADHHEWVGVAATKLLVGGDVLWQAMCAEWVMHRVDEHIAAPIVNAIASAIP